jgi:hypothetical protein
MLFFGLLQDRHQFHTEGYFQRSHQDHDQDYHNVPSRSFEPAWRANGGDAQRGSRNSSIRTQTSTQVKRPLNYYSASARLFPGATATPSWKQYRDEKTGLLTQGESAPLASVGFHNKQSQSAFPRLEGRRPHTALFTAQRAPPPFRVRPPSAVPLQYQWYFSMSSYF